MLFFHISSGKSSNCKKNRNVVHFYINNSGVFSAIRNSLSTPKQISPLKADGLSFFSYLCG